MDSRKLVEEAKKLFPANNRPGAFIRNPDHCCECAEHEETLREHDQDSIGIEQLGNAGWDPICFISPEGYKYYFPALVRLALNDSDNMSYIEQFLFSLAYDGPNNERFKSFSEEQKQFVRKLLLEIIDSVSISEEGQRWLEPDFDQALKVWRGGK